MSSQKLSVVFPCSVGDTVYSFEWIARKKAYEISEAKCLGFKIHTNDEYDIMLRGEKFEYLRSSLQYQGNWFVSLEEAQAKLGTLNREE